MAYPVLALLLVSCGAAAGLVRTPVAATAEGVRPAFAAFRHEFFIRMMDFAPEAASGLGLRAYHDKVSDLSAAAIARQIEFLRDAGAWLSRVPPDRLTAQERVDYRILSTVIASQLHRLEELKEWRTDAAAGLGPYEAVVARMAQVGPGPLAAAEWEAFAARTEKIPVYLSQVEANLREGLSCGWKPWRRLLEETAIAESGEAARFFASEFLDKAREQLADAELARLQPRLRAAGSAAAAAYAAHVAFLRAELLPRATDEEERLGAAEYSWRLRNDMGIATAPAELVMRAAELAGKITQRMEELAKTIDPSLDLPALMAKLKQDHPADDAAMLDEYRRVSERARDFVVQNGIFSLPSGYRISVIETPAGMRSALATAAYFPAPPYETGVNGVFLVTPTGDDHKRLANHNRYKIPTTVVHEAFPGHDLQFHMFQRSSDISEARWLMDFAGWASALNVEGYAHYAEELMRQKGFFSDPREELVQLGAQLWRAWRIALDAAYHMGWITLADAARLLSERAFIAEPIAKVEAYRYARKPLQALTYALGKLAIEDLKREYQAVMGPRYREGDFHALFLSFGPVPVSIIREAFLEQARAASGTGA